MSLVRRSIPQRHGFPVLTGGWPVLGHIPALHRDTLKLMRTAEQRLGPLFWVHMGFGLHYLVCLDPEGFKILKNTATSSRILFEKAAHFLGDSVMVCDGPAHRHLRSAMSGSFTPKSLGGDEIGPVLAETIQERVLGWTRRGRFRLLTETRELALDLIFRLIGIPTHALAEWRHQYEEFVLGALNVPIMLPGFPRWRARRARGWLDARLLEIIHRARAAPETGAMISQLTHSKDEAGEPLSDYELTENIRFLALAGHETTATTAAWMIFLLARHPDVWERLCAEAEAGDGVPRTPKELRQFPVAEALFREALRLHPPVTSDLRRVTGDLELCGRPIPVGLNVSVCIGHLSRHPTLYEEPDAFRIDRWLDRKDPISPIELVQFGGGPHFCLGYHVAWMELVQLAVALARVLPRAGLRPQLDGPMPAIHYLPLAHPDPSACIRFA